MVDAHTHEHDALIRAVEIAGSQSELARLLGVTATSVWKMVNKAKRMSTELVLKAEAATGISRHELRPDIYPLESHAPSASGAGAAPAAAITSPAAGAHPGPHS